MCHRQSIRGYYNVTKTEDQLLRTIRKLCVAALLLCVRKLFVLHYAQPDSILGLYCQQFYC